MHESTARLYLAVGELCDGKVKGQSALGRLLGQSPQVIKNWESRGVSAEGALVAQAKVGCDANWVLHGDGAMLHGWPFPMVLPSRFLALRPDQKSFVEGQLAAAIAECERAQQAKPEPVATATDARLLAASARRALGLPNTTDKTKRR